VPFDFSAWALRAHGCRRVAFTADRSQANDPGMSQANEPGLLQRQASTMSRERTNGAPDRCWTSDFNYTYTIPIEGRDEWLAAAGLRA
jgi:hypothetical protein